MPRIVRCSLIQASNPSPPDASLEATKKAMVEKHVVLIAQAAAAGSQITCLQEIFYGPYFCAEQTTRWYDFTEPVPDGPTIRLMQDLARQHHMALIVPIYERERRAFTTTPRPSSITTARSSASIARRTSRTARPVFGRSFISGRATWAIRSSTWDLRASASTSVMTVIFRKARALGLNGAEIVFNPSATVAGLSEHLWKLEQPAHAVANGYFVGAINRVGVEAPWKIGEFYGSSYFCDPRGRIFAQASRDRDEVLTADLDLDMIGEVRKTWQFFRDRRPDMYQELVKA
jgi:beta-ureidopropionase